MSDNSEPTQAMPEKARMPQPTQPTHGQHEPGPITDGEGFDTFMGHGGQSDIDDETPKDGGNPNATARSD